MGGTAAEQLQTIHTLPNGNLLLAGHMDSGVGFFGGVRPRGNDDDSFIAEINEHGKSFGRRPGSLDMTVPGQSPQISMEISMWLVSPTHQYLMLVALLRKSVVTTPSLLNWTHSVKFYGLDFGASGHDECFSLELDSEGNLLLAGYFRGDWSIGEDTYTSQGHWYPDGFLLKIDTEAELSGPLRAARVQPSCFTTLT